MTATSSPSAFKRVSPGLSQWPLPHLSTWRLSIPRAHHARPPPHPTNYLIAITSLHPFWFVQTHRSPTPLLQHHPKSGLVRGDSERLLCTVASVLLTPACASSCSSCSPCSGLPPKRSCSPRPASEARRCRVRNEAWEALESAVGAGSVDMLAAAISSAEAAGLTEAQLATARERHDALREEAQRRQAYDVALVGLRTALQRGQDAEFVEPVVRHAVEVGVAPRALMSPLADVEGAQELVTGAAALVLEAAVREGASARRAAAGGLSFLERAQEWSRAVGVSAELLEKARAQRASASEKVAEKAHGEAVKADAAQALAAAWQSPDATTCSLDMAIFAARFAGVNKRMLKLAQRRRDELAQDEEKRAAEAGLRAAVAAGRGDALEEAIQDSTRFSMSVPVPTWERKRQCSPKV
ncbi:unnamed protein product [Prorocentrum cordatum]|uniref:Uncharacterized protein n=1 Tax=Prorocentrum cordatum TaxID=2364126 RepID=A0ABN9RBF8_9DINO|nr:unnamed protein product [Polarella glacialis]